MKEARANLESIYKLERELKNLRNRLAYLEARIEDDEDQIASFEASIAILKKKIENAKWNIKRHESKIAWIQD